MLVRGASVDGSARRRSGGVVDHAPSHHTLHKGGFVGGLHGDVWGGQVITIGSFYQIS